ncbi:MAG: BatD family protein [Longimicrobiales bacterium]
MLLHALLTGALLLQQGDATVRAELSSHATAVGRPVVLTISVRTQSAENALIQLPRMPDGLQIIGTSSSTEIEISMPGGRTNITREELRIMPLRPGQYSILPATVRLGRSVYATERLDLSVGGSARAQATDDVPVRLRASISPQNPYVGQQLLLRLDALLPMDARFHPVRPPSYDPPSPSGFWIQDLPDPITGSLQTIGGAQFEVQTYQRVLFPLSAGSFTIPSARLIYDLRGGVFFAPETREALSDSLRVTVRPLPEEGKPATFNGAVGVFIVSGGIDRANASTGDAVTYTMRIEGTGSVKSLPPPVFPSIPDVDVYPPSEDATLRVVNGIIGGARTFQWVLIPRRAGTAKIPPVEYAWFDPDAGQYRSAVTAPMTMTVAAAGPSASSAMDTTLAPLRLAPGSRAASITRSQWFLAAQLVPLALLLLMLAIRRRLNSGPTPRARRTAMIARVNALAPLAASDGRQFYQSALALLHEARGSSDDASFVRQVDVLAEQIRGALYAPALPGERERLAHLDQLRKLVTMLAGASRKGTGTAVVIALLLLPALLWAAPSAHFGDGVASYARADYAAAAAAFQLHVKDAPRDAAAWYDLGNAYYRSNDPGRAVWGWLHALQLEPRNTDAAHNLELLNSQRAAAAVQTWIPVSTAELTILAAALWWFCMLATAIHITRRRSASRLIALLLATGCATALIMVIARWAGPDTVVPVGYGATLYAGPTARTEARAKLDVGDAAVIIRREKDWLLVRTSDHSEGWVQVGAVSPL